MTATVTGSAGRASALGSAGPPDPWLLAADLFDPQYDEDVDQARRSLRHFTRLAWPLVEPATVYRSNWHIDAICDHLEAVTSGEIRRLIINIPPRHMKSLTVGVFWPAWEWLEHPSVRWMFASYGADLAERDSVNCRRVIESRGGRTVGGTLLEQVGYRGLLRLLGQSWQLTGDQNVKSKFENDKTGYRIATSIDGRATGEGGERLVADDPHKASEVMSDAKRKAVLDWIDQTWMSRRNDPKTSSQVMVMQRLHRNDATGHLLDKGGWEHLCLPAEFEPSHPFRWPDDPRTTPGELLWPDRMGTAEIEQTKTDLGSYGYAGQYQQLPSPAEGGIIKRHWWRYYPPEALDDLRQFPDFQELFQSWDTSLKAKTTSDFAVGQLWGVHLANRYLLRQVRGRWGLVETKTQVAELTRWALDRWPALGAHRIYIENKANGPEVLADMQSVIGGLVPVNPSIDKVSRVMAVTPQLEAGNILVPGYPSPELNGPDIARTPAWVQELIEEAAQFPAGANDDQVDALSQALDPARTFLPDPDGAPGEVERADSYVSEFGSEYA